MDQAKASAPIEMPKTVEKVPPSEDEKKEDNDAPEMYVREAKENANGSAATSKGDETAAPSDLSQELADGSASVGNGAPVDDVQPAVVPITQDGSQSGDIEAAICADEETQGIEVEEAAPPETPLRDAAKKDIDPESPTRETDPEVSFDSSQGGADGDYDKKSNKRRKHFIFGGISVVLIVGAVLGILFGTGIVGTKNEDATTVSEPQVETNGSPTIAPAPTEEVVPPPAPTEEVVPPPAPTESTVVQDDPLLETLKAFSSTGLDDTASPQYQAYQWLLNEDPLTDANTEPTRLAQRYSLATMYASLSGDIPSYATQNECEWPTVACGSPSTNATSTNDTSVSRAEPWQVTEINMARQSFTGSIPAEIGLLSSLTFIDIGENEVSGSIPDELYQLTNLEHIYLHNNQMTGTLSEGIGNLQLLDALYLGSNNFSGPIPINIGSQGATRRPLRFLILGRNEFTGTIPNGMSLTSMFHMDLSFNQLTGTLPADIGENFNHLRQLYLDHNQFTGTIPETYPLAGGGRLYVLALDNNQLTGGVPTGWDKDNLFLDTLTVQGNQLTEPIDKEICKLSALENGELVQVGAECAICTCSVLCDNCY
jgi:hypothetical protein